jgi:hypothetical protein
MNKEKIYSCFISDDNFINLPKYLKRHLLIDIIRIKKNIGSIDSKRNIGLITSKEYKR